MADGYCQGVGSIIRFGDMLELELNSHHILNLLFIPMTVARDVLFNFEWCIFVNRKSTIGSGQDCNPTGLPNGEGSSQISGNKELYRYFGWMVLFYKSNKIPIEDVQPLGNRLLSGGRKAPVVDCCDVVVVPINQAVAHRRNARINTQNTVQHHRINELYSARN